MIAISAATYIITFSSLELLNPKMIILRNLSWNIHTNPIDVLQEDSLHETLIEGEVLLGLPKGRDVDFGVKYMKITGEATGYKLLLFIHYFYGYQIDDVTKRMVETWDGDDLWGAYRYLKERLSRLEKVTYGDLLFGMDTFDHIRLSSREGNTTVLRLYLK